MKSSNRRLQAIVASALAIVAMAALAAPAMAEEVEANFGTAERLTLTTSGITLKQNGLKPVPCTLQKGETSGPIFGSSAMLYNEQAFYRTLFNCYSSTLRMNMVVYPVYETSESRYYLCLSGDSMLHTSIYGNYIQEPTCDNTWTNGSGSTHSTVSFQDTPIGTLVSSGATLSITGTFTAKTPEGGLITLSH